MRACIQRTTHVASSSTTKRRSNSTATSTSTLTTIDEHNDYMTVVLTFVPDQHSVGRVSLFAS